MATAYGAGPATLRNWLVKYREADDSAAAFVPIRSSPPGMTPLDTITPE